MGSKPVLSGQDLMRLALRQGWRVRGGKGTHRLLFPPNDGAPVMISLSGTNHERTKKQDTLRCVKAGLRL